MLRGGDGQDGLDGGAGNDQLFGDAKDDVLVGEVIQCDAPDRLHPGKLWRRPARRRERRGRALCVLFYRRCARNLTGADNGTLIGGSGDDEIFGSTGADTISGGSGDDEVTAGGGDDTISGGSGGDS